MAGNENKIFVFGRITARRTDAPKESWRNLAELKFEQRSTGRLDAQAAHLRLAAHILHYTPYWQDRVMERNA
jgi:hypothetical protein